MMQFVRSICQMIEQTVDGLEKQHWAILAVMLVAIGYMFLRRGHA